MKAYVVCFALLTAGCYEYTAFQPSERSLGKAVRVQLSEPGTEHVTAQVGPHADYLDGNLASVTDSAYTIAVSELGRTNGVEESRKGEPITVKRGDVDLLTLRKAARAKSAGFTALLVGAAVLAGRAVSGISGTGVTKPGGTGNGQ